MSPGTAVTPVERTEQIQNIALGRLIGNSANPRKELRDLDDLVASVKRRGILVPLTVEVVGGNYRIIAGHRRLVAAQKVGLKAVPCIVRRYTDDDRFESMLIDNIQRKDLDPIEEAEAYQQLIDRGLNQTQVAERVGKSMSTISVRLTLLDLPAELRRKVAAGKIGIYEAVGYYNASQQTNTRCKSCGQQLPKTKGRVRAAAKQAKTKNSNEYMRNYMRVYREKQRTAAGA